MALLGMVVFFILFSGFFNAASGASPSARLELPVGFNRSVSDSYMRSTTSNSTLATSAYNNGVFIPFLSSERFNITSDTGPGFSLGFLFNNISNYSADHGAAMTADIYLSVCVGRRSGSAKQNMQGFQYLVGRDDEGYYDSNWAALEAGGGYGVPVWVANTGRPLRSVNASLVVVSDGGGGGKLQLTDYNGRVVWTVSTASAMEMQDDTGDLVIYSSNGTTVWQSSQQEGLRALATGQAFTAGMELASDDSLYTLRMLPGGLVFYLNKHFVQQPTPYWIIPFTSLSANSHTLIDSSLNPSFPSSLNCSNDPISMALLGPPDSTNISYQFTERCSQASQKLAAISFPASDGGSSAWVFSKLEDDGRLYVYTVFDNTSHLVKGPGDGLDSGSLDAEDKSLLNLTPSKMPRFYWGACDVPMACGPLGLCASPSSSSQASANCTCPPENFSFINSMNPSQGCTRIQHSLEEYCKSEATLSVSFLELLNTSTILIFGAGLQSNSSKNTSVEECKSDCKSNCSCSGVFYVVDSSSCFQMTDEISLLTVSNKSFLYFNSSQPTAGISSYNISANNYITYLKVITENPAKKKQGIGALLLFKLLVALGVVLVLFVVLVQLLHWIARLRRRRRQIMAGRSSQKLQEEEEEQELQDLLPMLPTRFSFQELENATQSFSKLLGAGGCGSVYAGLLPDGRKVAVKILDSLLLRTISKQFLAEVACIGRTSHHHIVRLVGFCWEHSNRLLVYEYMERGSLDQWIFQLGPKSDEGGGGPLLDWPTRYNIALGIARGLTYLHEECSEPILHFDIKPQNILLDDAFVAKLADFGMSRLIQRDISQVITDVRGTPGYIAPEWLSHGAVSKKCDVYSMGMVMLEIIGGRKNSTFHLQNSENDYADECHFPTWVAKKCEAGMTTQDVVDKRLQGAFDQKQAQILIMSALWCIQQDPSLRPFAHTVVQWLEGSSDVKRPPFNVVVPVQFRLNISSSSQSYTPSIHYSSTPGLEYQG